MYEASSRIFAIQIVTLNNEYYQTNVFYYISQEKCFAILTLSATSACNLLLISSFGRRFLDKTSAISSLTIWDIAFRLKYIIIITLKLSELED